MNLQTLNIQRKMILAAAAAGLVSVFLPWFTIDTGFLGSMRINGFRGYGMGAFFAFGFSVFCALMGKHEETLDKKMWTLALAAGSLALIFIAIGMANTDMSGGFGLVKARYGIGIWIALIASLGIIFSAWKFKKPEDTLEIGINSFVKSIPITERKAEATSPLTSHLDEIERLAELRNSNKITQEEFELLKAKMI